MNFTKSYLAESKTIIKSIVEILDSYNQLYKKLSKNREKVYLEYFAKEYADERDLISPTLFHDFLEQILGFSKNDFIPESSDSVSGKRPDFIPTDTNLHSFVFDTKGTDIIDLKTYYTQIKGYIESHNLEYGILCNMRDLAVFSPTEKEPIQEFTFSFYQLYLDYQKCGMAPLEQILTKPNTKRFLSFVKKFHFQKLDNNIKIRLISEKKQWTGKETLEPEHLMSKIRSVVSSLREDVKRQGNDLPKLVASNDRKQKIIQEIDSILEEIGKKEKDITNLELNDIIKDGNVSLVQAKDVYFYRTAYFAMTRILLVRAWEDIKFIDESLYNGGFKKWYENFNKQIREVLRNAFGLAGRRYSWLYGTENNYTWYEPSEDVLIDVLYEFSQFNFSKLNVDVLGTVYEEYVDRTDRKNKGQYYTPREIVSFIWDRVGFTNDKAFFRTEGNKRQPRLIFDPATGSGGFLVEAARRIREESRYNRKSFTDLQEIEQAIVNGLFGSEISAFAHYITEVNLLLQLTHVIKNLIDAHSKSHPFRPAVYALSVIRQDSMKLQIEQRVLPMTDIDILKDVRYEHDAKYDHIALEGAKREKFNFIRDGKDFDYVCANPPYVGESGHKELFRSTFKYQNFWQNYYQGKMDYLYWFIILGLYKLREGGKLGFITTSYWPTADGSSKLRKYILQNALIKDFIDFGETKIFEGAPGQHNMVFVLEKCSDQNKQENNEIKVVKVKKEFSGETVKGKLQKLTEHISRNINKEKFSDDYIEIFVGPVKQGELTENAWNLMYSGKIEKILLKIKNSGTLLGEICNINQGYVSGCHKATNENLKNLPQSIIEKYSIKSGDGIFVLSNEELESLNLDDKEKEIVKPTYKNSDISIYITDEEDNEWLIYTTKDTKINDYPKIKSHLEKFGPILEQKRECKEGKIPWFSLHWSRDQNIFESEKIVAPYRAEFNTFGYNDRCFYGSTDMYFITRKSATKESLKYILALLDSKLLDLWCYHQLKPKGKVREYFPTPLSQIPICRIDFKNPKEVKIHDELVQGIDEIIETKKELAKFNKYFSKRLTRLSDNEPFPEIDLKKFLDELPEKEKLSLRLHPQIKITPEQDLFKSFKENEFYLARIKEEKNKLILFGKNKTSLVISGENSLIRLLNELLTNYIGKPFPEIKNSILLPESVSTFNRKLEKTLAEVKNLRDKVKNTQKAINNIVYDLYGITEKEKRIIEKELTI